MKPGRNAFYDPFPEEEIAKLEQGDLLSISFALHSAVPERTPVPAPAPASAESLVRAVRASAEAGARKFLFFCGEGTPPSLPAMLSDAACGAPRMCEWIVPPRFALPSVLPENVLVSFLLDSPGGDAFLPPGAETVHIPYPAEEHEGFLSLWRRLRGRGIGLRLDCSEAFVSPVPERLRAFLDAIREIDAHYGLPPGVPDVPFAGGEPCMDYRFSCHIGPDGSVHPCRGSRVKMGSVAESPLGEILRFSHARKFYLDFRKRIKEPCRSCAVFGKCGGCRGRAFAFSGDYIAADPACAGNASRTDEIERLPAGNASRRMPHKPPMLMAGEILEMDDNRSVSSYTVAEANLFLRADGTLHPAALIEIAAQSMAFLDTFLHPDGALEGMLVEVTRFSHAGLPVRAGDRLLIYNRKESELEPWHVGSFEIRFSTGESVAKGEFKVCLMENNIPF